MALPKSSVIQNRLLSETGLMEPHLEQTLSLMLGRGVDWADLYLQSQMLESWTLEEGRIKEGHFNADQGIGFRVISGEKTGLAYSNAFDLPTLKEAALAARSIVRQGQSGTLAVQPKRSTRPLPALYQPENPVTSVTDESKIKLLKHLDGFTRGLDARVQQVVIHLTGVFESILLLNNEERFITDERPLVRLNVTVVVEEQGRREQGRSGGGGRHGYAHFYDHHYAVPEQFCRAAVRQALLNLEARPAPAGCMTVVLGPGWPGILLHEAVGHGLEGDFNRKGTSLFSNQLGECIASPCCTVIDDGTLAGRRGSLNVDDEGTPTQSNVLIENGRLVGYLQDRLNARLMHTAPTGNGRRESYAHMPLPRMTNTYLAPGEASPTAILESMERGLYAVNFGGGQVDISSGQFVFTTSEAYWVEQGKIQYPVKGATLIGSGPEVMKRITMVGNDWALDEGIGTCGKEGQSVPVGVGQPTLKIEGLTVGGTAL